MRVVSLLALLAVLGCSTEPDGGEVASSQSALDPTPTGTWKLRDRGNPSFEDHARTVYHTRMAKVLLVSARPNRGVFGWDGSDWTHIAPSSSALFMQGATYDEELDRIVLFGGLEADHVGAGSSRSTWLLQGAAWQELKLFGPAAGGGATLTYDAARKRSVLTGGASHTNATPRAETWLFDGAAWMKAVVTESPASQYAGAAYDRARELVVVVRPLDSTSSETWEWNGTTWSRSAASAPLPYEYSYSLAYDEAAKRVVSLLEGALWGWNGSAWSRVDVSDGRESERKRATIAYDSARSRLVAVNASTYTWEYDGSAWHRLPPKRPRPRQRAASTYDSARRRVMYFGSVSDPEDVTWEWDGASWMRGAPGTSATPTGLGMTYDGKRKRAVLVFDNKTWESDGSAWVEVAAAPGSLTLMAFDDARGQTIGLLGSATWSWDGASWRQLMVDGPTSARDSAMAYDALRQRIVRFGGYLDGSGTSQIDETWEWDGSRWSLSSPLARPSARGGHTMAFDARRSLIVLYGGYRHNEVWEYDGSTWVQRVTKSGPPGSFSNGLVYDAEHDRMVFYASEGTLWEFQPVGDGCTSGDECSSGACVAGVCCDRACSSSCEACSVATGATQNGVCELLPDAGPKCMSSEVDAGLGDAGEHAANNGDGGCSISQQSSRTSWQQGLLGMLMLAALSICRRCRARRARREVS
jgi:hypothetical protein